MHAFVDESYTDSRYTFGVCLLEPYDLDDARERMRSLLLPGQKKVHWHEENTKRRRVIARTVASISARHLIVVRHSSVSERPERQRRLCMEHMLVQLEAMHASTVTLESRLKRDDHRDHLFIDALRVCGVITSRTRVQHRLGPSEPLLWMADALCGMFHWNDRGVTLSAISRLEVMQFGTERT